MERSEGSPPHVDIYSYFPENFFHKSVNEPFIQKIMSIVLEQNNWTPGNPDLSEPDYFCGSIPFEFTIASDKKKKNNFIQKYQTGQYTSEDVECDVFGYIETALKSKSKKRYSVPNVHLCVLCLIDGTPWVLDKYGSITCRFADWRREEFFSEIKKQYINSKIFGNVFLIFPDICAKWWVWDILTNARSNIQVLPSQIKSQSVPFIIEQRIFDKILTTFSNS